MDYAKVLMKTFFRTNLVFLEDKGKNFESGQVAQKFCEIFLDDHFFDTFVQNHTDCQTIQSVASYMVSNVVLAKDAKLESEVDKRFFVFP
jgi:hypothetical protein